MVQLMGYSIPGSKRVSNCETCGEPILWRFLELFEKQHQNQTLHWRRVLIRRLGWTPFDIENPGLIHQHQHNDNDKKPNSNPRIRPKTEVMTA